MGRTSLFRFLFAALVAVSLAAACEIRTYNNGACKRTQECDKSCSCQQGQCLEERNRCVTSADCLGGSTCIHNVCHPSCNDNLDCHDSEYCLGGSCRLIPPQARKCTTSSSCTAGELCINGVCSLGCSKDVDCHSGQVCEGMFCAPGTQPPPPDGGFQAPSTTCRYNSDCAPGSYCINATCHRGCATDANCPTTELCKSGICQTRATVQCSTGADCPTGNDCVDATCRSRCAYSTQCLPVEACTLGYCLPSSPTACATNCDCPAGQRCLNGQCLP